MARHRCAVRSPAVVGPTPARAYTPRNIKGNNLLTMDTKHDADKNGWIDKEKRPPTETDCDDWHCIMVWHTFQGLMIMGVHNTMINRFVTHWRPSLPPPEAYTKDPRKE